ncbi:MbcA/ParS/Xre antitoxin family protein [Halomonas sp. PBN3]|uniref:MbcA/ParS/Xre antitoxin family protein n=1 Tax=Halomonas sp. PBN3 TaxID=1397528 RepID=UPI0003B9226F|nr:MbcA/ParS/Xre antitoxin family protein [Halomonas sp. PBN3]ERS91407.1 hypothetical protein Q671_16665 [Halomonas sp. PBN3]
MHTAVASPKHSSTEEKSPRTVLGDALVSAAQELGVSFSELETIVGRHRTSIMRKGVDPASKSGELSLLLIRAYRALGSLTGWDEELMRHWLGSPNEAIAGASPKERIKTIIGLTEVVHYLESLRDRP